MLQKYLDELLEVSTVKDEDEYVLGYYYNKVPVYGLYLKAKEDSPLEQIEIMAKAKFKLEKDGENYAQEVRCLFFEKMEEYFNDKGMPNTQGKEKDMFAYLYKSCRNTMTDLARWSKSTVSVYDDRTKTYSIVSLLSIDNDDKEIKQSLEKEIENRLEEINLQSFSEFREWFNKNKTNILTKKQLSYLEDEQSILHNHRARMNRTICERINKKYSDSTIIEERIKKVDHKKEVLKEIIINSNPRHFMNKLVEKMKTETWLLDEVYSLSFSTCRMVTQACSNLRKYECYEERVEEIREKLKKLNNYLSVISYSLREKL